VGRLRRVEPACEDGELLDCVAVNLAVLLRHVGAEDSRSPFACQWCFAFPPETGELPVLEHRPLLTVIAEQSGYRMRDLELPEDRLGDRLAEVVTEAGPVLLLGDAYDMDWVPYHGHVHMEHSFIVDGVSSDGRWAEVADGYVNRTEWGDAVPCRARVAVAELIDICSRSEAGCIRAGVLEPAVSSGPVDAAAWLRRNADAMCGPEAANSFERFVDRSRLAGDDMPARFDQFVLACWLVARARALHARWLASLTGDPAGLLPPGFAAAFMDTVAGSWRKAMEFSYVAGRRVRQGRAMPPAPFDIVASQAAPAEQCLAEQLATWLGGGR
jgi:hypothetical protein